MTERRALIVEDEDELVKSACEGELQETRKETRVCDEKRKVKDTGVKEREHESEHN